MGSPDLPNDEDNICRPVANALPMHGNGTVSDDSDIENNENGYVGYQPLAFNEETMEYTNENTTTEDAGSDADDDYDYQSFNAPTVAPEIGIVVQSIDAEVENDIWNAPRPESSNIVLDPARTEQIISVMANISIPNSYIPTWAHDVSEEKWKEDLLQRIRQRQNSNSNP